MPERRGYSLSSKERTRTRDSEAVWEAKVPCADEPELFLSSAPQQEKKAKKLCNTCPAEEVCLEEALNRREEDGTWGGKTANERKAILRKRPSRLI